MTVNIRRLSIATKNYLAILTLLLGLLTVGVVAWIDAGEQARIRGEQEVDDGLDAFKSDFDRAMRDLLALGNGMAGQSNFVQAVQARNMEVVAQQVQPWTEVSIADSITATYLNGTILAQVSRGNPLFADQTTSGWPGVKEALAGRRSNGLGQDQGERLFAYVALPIQGSEPRLVVGALVLSFYIDGSFLQYRTRKPGEEIAFVYQDQMSIITLTDSQGKSWRGSPAPEAVLKAQKAGRVSDFIVLDTELGRHLFRFKPLLSATGNPLGMYGVGVAISSVEDQRWSLFRTVGLGLAIVIVAAGLLGFLYARGITRPIGVLAGAARAMASGNLAHPIDLPRGDEFGELAGQMESMRAQLQGAFKSVTLEKSRNEAVIQSMGIAAIVTDSHLEIVSANAAAMALLQLPQDRLVGVPWRNAFETVESAPSAGSGFSVKASISPSTDSELTLRGRFRLKAYPQILVDVISTQVVVDGSAAGFVHILYDASVQEDLVRAKDEFIMNAAHELRGPLSSLRASVEVLVDDSATMSRQELALMLRTMQKGVIKFQALVENLVDMGNIQAGKFRVRPVPTRMDGIVQDATVQVASLLQGRGQALQLKNECIGLLVMADRARVVQVLINLLTNASKYGPANEPITVAVSRSGAKALVQVTDRGPGIPPDEQAQLFRRFFRARRVEEEGVGIGLGLALAREIIQAHGGQIDVKSHVGEGTDFWFSLPVVDTPLPTLKAPSSENR